MSDVACLTRMANVSRLHGRERPYAIASDFKDCATSFGELDRRAS